MRPALVTIMVLVWTLLERIIVAWESLILMVGSGGTKVIWRGDGEKLAIWTFDSNLISLNSLVSSYNITSFPSVIINEKTVFSEISSKEEIFP